MMVDDFKPLEEIVGSAHFYQWENLIECTNVGCTVQTALTSLFTPTLSEADEEPYPLSPVPTE